MLIQPVTSRQQISFGSLEDAITHDNEVRFIEAFVAKLSLDKLGFIDKTQKETTDKKKKIYGNRIMPGLLVHSAKRLS